MLRLPAMLPLALWALMLLPLAAQEVAAPAYVGVVASEGDSEPGLVVQAVAPASPAAKAGILAGDRLLRVGRAPVNSSEALRLVVKKGHAGEQHAVELLRGGQRITLQVVLEPRPQASASSHLSTRALGADNRIHPVELPHEIRQQIRQHRRHLLEQLASLPGEFDPGFVTSELQAIRNLARDARATRPGWMSGRAGEISVRFRDAEGSVILFGANNLVSVELYDAEGQLLARYKLNTPEERAAIPQPVCERLQRFR